MVDLRCSLITNDVDNETKSDIVSYENLKINNHIDRQPYANAATVIASSDLDIQNNKVHENTAQNFGRYCKEMHQEIFNLKKESSYIQFLDNCDGDESSTSPTSSSTSLDIPKTSYFPRGIINPNYPGFQHFAHKLSEHFVENSPSDCFDSDMSEYEMELSIDSVENLSTEEQPFDINNYNNNNNKNSLSQAQTEQSNNLISTRKLQFFDNFSMENDNIEMAVDANCNTQEDREFSTIDMKYDTSNAADGLSNMQQGTSTLSNNSDCDINFKSNWPQNFSTTPDILIENSGQCLELLRKKENRPDLLNGVSPQRLGNKNVELMKCRSEYYLKEAIESIEMSQLHVGQIESNNYLLDGKKEEIPFRITPVDIIGDFGEEVEREFGLLVSGYRRMVDTATETTDAADQTPLWNQTKIVTDATLSDAKENLDSEKFVVSLKKFEYDIKQDDANELSEKKDPSIDWSKPLASHITSGTAVNNFVKIDINEMESGDVQKPKYQRPSYDERQLPPVAIDYKRCQQSWHTLRKLHNSEKSSKNPKLSRNNTNTRCNSNHARVEKIEKNANRIREEEQKELYRYQQLISDKESILSNSKYTKLSSWAKYLKNSERAHNSKDSNELISHSALELFDAYKIGLETDMETLRKHLKLAKEIEKRRRNDREEIRRRLAMGSEEQIEQHNHGSMWKNNSDCRLNRVTYATEISSDTESHSSDSETCPKLSKTRTRNPHSCSPTLIDKSSHLCNESTSSGIWTNNFEQLQPQQQMLVSLTNEDRECDFFTKQARLQIEARMALAQAKGMANMQMEIDRQNQCMSPITGIIRGFLENVGVKMIRDKRRVSRQILTDMNLAQLQVLVNNLHTYIEELNESLVNFLIQRDDLHMGQDTMLADIEELTRYIGTKEQIIKQQFRN